jgi:DNA-binding HxlR family transcriptional regulator
MDVLSVVAKKFAFEILAKLEQSKEGLRHHDIMLEIVKNPSTTTARVEELQGAGLIQKIDSRYRLTAKAQKILPHIKAIHEVG